MVATLILVFVGYPTTFETLSRGRSLGKMALGLRVVSDDGGPVRFRQSLWRAGAALIEIWALTGAPALICSLLSAKGKRIGDLFAGTFVIQERLPRRPGLPAALAVVPPPLAGWAQALELSGLSDQTAEQASSYLRRFYELTPTARDEFGQRIAAAVAAQVTPPPPPGTSARRPSCRRCSPSGGQRETDPAGGHARRTRRAASGLAPCPGPGGPGAPGGPDERPRLACRVHPITRRPWCARRTGASMPARHEPPSHRRIARPWVQILRDPGGGWSRACRQESRYSCWAGVSASISVPSEASASAAIWR